MPDMTGRIALVGGDEFRVGCEEMDRALLEATGSKKPRVLVVPTAAVEGPSTAASNGVSYFSGLGADASPLMVVDGDTAGDARYIDRLEDADMVYLTGGDPAHLLETLAGSAFLDGLRGALARGAIVAGSSAGAMVMGEWMSYRGWTRALGMLRAIAVLPHHERSDPDAVAAELDASAPGGLTVLGVDAKSCCLGGPEGWEVLGPGSVRLYTEGGWRRYGSGDLVPLQTSVES
jgi:cyanophycinase